MLEDTMETLDDDELEDEADEEVDKVLFDLTAGKILCTIVTGYPADPWISGIPDMDLEFFILVGKNPGKRHEFLV